MVGGRLRHRTHGDLKVAVIDMDGDKVYGEVGQDALVLGSSENAAYLSETLVVGETVHSLTVARDGSQLTLGAYDGPSGPRGDGRPGGRRAPPQGDRAQRRRQAQLRPRAARRGALPRSGATARTGPARSRRRTRRGPRRPHAPDRGHGGADTTLAWGADQGRVRVRASGRRFDPNRVWWYGAAGEYRGWAPIGKSPEFTIKERKLDELKKRLPGQLLRTRPCRSP